MEITSSNIWRPLEEFVFPSCYEGDRDQKGRDQKGVQKVQRSETGTVRLQDHMSSRLTGPLTLCGRSTIAAQLVARPPPDNDGRGCEHVSLTDDVDCLREPRSGKPLIMAMTRR